MPASNTRKRKRKSPAKSALSAHPHPVLCNHQARHRIRLRKLEAQTRSVLSHLSPDWPPRLRVLEVHFISSAAIQTLHADYLDDPTPTDIITFDTEPVGQLYICPEVAHHQCSTTRLSLHRELLTYIIHGCLHLCGMEDHSETGFAAMQHRQNEILGRI